MVGDLFAVCGLVMPEWRVISLQVNRFISYELAAKEARRTSQQAKGHCVCERVPPRLQLGSIKLKTGTKHLRAGYACLASKLRPGCDMNKVGSHDEGDETMRPQTNRNLRTEDLLADNHPNHTEEQDTDLFNVSQRSENSDVLLSLHNVMLARFGNDRKSGSMKRQNFQIFTAASGDKSPIDVPRSLF